MVNLAENVKNNTSFATKNHENVAEETPPIQVGEKNSQGHSSFSRLKYASYGIFLFKVYFCFYCI